MLRRCGNVNNEKDCKGFLHPFEIAVFCCCVTAILLLIHNNGITAVDMVNGEFRITGAVGMGCPAHIHIVTA
mgnify:CR=1 FL=1